MKQYIAIISLALFLVSLNFSDGAIQCSDVIKDLGPCLSYLKSGSGSPSTACCSGVTTLAGAASTTSDRRAACSCIMSTVSKINPNVAAVQGLPASCGVTLPFTVSPNIDCSKIS